MTKTLWSSVAAITVLFVLCDSLVAQQDRRKYRYDSMMPPGQIGQQQLLRRAAMRDYAQPVELIAPPGAHIAVFDGGAFQHMGSSKVTVGMLIGQTYRIKVTQIPNQPGLEVFPSIEVINRLYPPPGLELKFPVQVDLAVEDLLTAAEGSIVTRVVYLENPEEAIPDRQQRDEQPYFDVSPGNDPLKVAQQIGRPMVIVRCGSITPDGVDMHEFTFGAPPLQLFATTQTVPAINTMSEPGEVPPTSETISDQIQR